MALVQMCLHSALSWGRLITRDGGEREGEAARAVPSSPWHVNKSGSGRAVSCNYFFLTESMHVCVWKIRRCCFLLLLHHTAFGIHVDRYRGL